MTISKNDAGAFSLDTAQKEVLRKVRQGRDPERRGAQYRPWLYVHEVPSRGQSRRVSSEKTGRVHHLLSLTEFDFFIFFEWHQAVIDIREQYALLPVEETVELACQCGIRPPCKRGNEVTVVTSDFVITRRAQGREREEAFTVKKAEDLSQPRTLEKLEIERRYWQRRGVPWAIATERELPAILIQNLRRIRRYQADENDGDEKATAILRRVEDYLHPEVLRHDRPLRDLTAQCDERFALPSGTSLRAVWRLVLSGRWRVDLTTQVVDPCQPLKLQPSG